MTIFFKNGMSVYIQDEVAKIISENITKGAKSFQIFSGEDRGVFFIVNLEEIVYIK